MSSIFRRVTAANMMQASEIQDNDQNTVVSVASNPHNQTKNIVAPTTPTTTLQKIFVHDYRMDMFIGVWEAEKKHKQTVIINVDLTVTPTKNWNQDNIDDVLSYMDIIDHIEMIAARGHINLLENFAHQITAACFTHAEVSEVTVEIDKVDILKEKGRVGVHLTQKRDV